MNLIKEIEDSIVHAKKEGYILISENWGDEKHKCACALSCVLVKNKVKLNEDEARTNVYSLLNVNEAWVEAFISGFDDTPWDLKMTLGRVALEKMSKEELKNLKDAYDAGRFLNEKFKPMPHHEFYEAFVEGQDIL